MNFEFLKNLNGLNRAYKPCSNAESMINSHPDSSVIQARKGAELLAKFIYMAAHAEEVQDFTFADVLADSKVRCFINDKRIMNAFHYIRKSGNRAAHAECETSPQLAIDVLRNLHLVAGETATKMELVPSYPPFDEHFAGDADEVLFSNADIELSKEAIQAFVEYIKSKEPQHLVTVNLGNPAHRSFSLRNEVQMHERIEFDHQPYLHTTMEYLRSYLAYFDNIAYDYRTGAEDGQLQVAVEINRELVYKGDADKVPSDIQGERLSQAECFAIELWVDAKIPIFHDNPEENALTDAIDEDDTWQGRGMADHLEGLKRKEQFTYKAIFRYPNDDSHTEFAYICNGKSYAVEDLCKDDIVQKASDCQFFGGMITLHTVYDMDAHPEILPQLRDAVREHVPDELEYMEDTWEEQDEDGDPHYLGYILSGCNVDDKDLRRSQQFADRVNQILAPIANECTFDCVTPALNHCFYDMEKLAVASFVWKDQKLQIVGTIL